MNSTAPFHSELQEAIRIAREAGRILISRYERPGDVEQKQDGTPVSRADRESAAYITEQLRARFPDYAILNEEQREDGARFRRPFCWVVDPLDGTKEYLEKIPDFGVMIGLIKNFQPVLGVTLKPLANELAWAAAGQGAFMADEAGTRALHVSGANVSDNAGRIRAIVSRSRRNAQLDAMLAVIEPSEVIQMGGSLKIIEVAKGAADVFLCPPGSEMHLWDLCAAQAILTEAGGRLTNARGRPIDYAQPQTANRNGVVAANLAVHGEVIRKIAPLLK